MAGLIAPVARLIEELSKLPGIGTKTAQRLTYHVLRASTDDARGGKRRVHTSRQR